MKYSNEYYEKTIMHNKPSKILQKFFDMKLDKNITQKTAIDLGCGAGNDTIFLLNNNFVVTAVDKEKKIIDIINERLGNQHKDNIKFIINDFETLKLSKANLMFSNFSLFFCNPLFFNNFINEIICNINFNGYFVGNFIGNEDDWASDNTRTFVTKNQILDIFKNFNIVYLEELKYTKDSLKSKNKFWHVFNIIAQKRNL